MLNGKHFHTLKVKSVRLSRGCAAAGAAVRQANTATAQAKPKMRVLSMIGLLVCVLVLSRVQQQL
jgi:hypothetical protein